ncbi:MAG: hypothetical protein M3256_20470 [Actinomycetota bacterium]|nr:hypothetical protein [Actinomycetota bacterium]
MDISANIEEFLGGRESTSSSASFDYCFNYFQAHREQGSATALADEPLLELSCLQLGFYLASWGMMRGSAVLSRKSVKYLAPVVEVIANAPYDIWDIDADRYSDQAIATLLRMRDSIRSAFPEGASVILVTKIMLGVFGCVPAFDTYFQKGFGVTTLNEKSLKQIAQWCLDNAENVDRHRVATLDFNGGRLTERVYTRAKVIDMIFFVEGMHKR